MMFRDEHHTCPACGHALITQPSSTTRLWCEACRGVLIPLDELSSLPGFDPSPVGTPGDRQCPRCAAKLARFTLFEIELDRCDAHGVWFDAKEFLGVLDQTGRAGPKLRRLLELLFDTKDHR